MSPPALLQIAEPGQSSRPRNSLRLAGIDLGTTHSLVAVCVGGKPQVLSLDSGPLLPSAVAYAGDRVQVGAQALSAPTAALTSFKRLMGLTHGQAKAAAAKNICPLCEQREDDKGVLLDTGSGCRSPAQVSAEILKVLAGAAELRLGGPLDGVVITVPAYFDEAQRQATAQAAQLAELPLLRLIAEPTAATLAYGLNRQTEGAVLVYDLGGGTFDCSVVKLTPNVFEVLASVGDTQLGGDDMDLLLARQALAHWGLSEAAAAWPQLLRQARRIKEQLSTAEQAVLCAEVAGKKRQFKVSRGQFAALIAPVLRRTLGLCRRALRDAGLSVDELAAVALVGGATRVPALQQSLEEFFRRPPLCDLDPDQVVAEGAARQAMAVAGAADAPLLVDVTPLSLGLETMGGLTEKVIERNTPVPAMKAREFTTARDGQTGLSLHVVQGERELAEHCRSLARFSLSGIPPMAAGAARIRVSFQLDENGLLTVSAREQVSGVSASVQTSRTAELSGEELKRALHEAHSEADRDAAELRLRRRREEARAMLAQVQSALQQDGEALLDGAQSQRIAQCMRQVEQALEQDDVRPLARAMESFAAEVEHFAQLRMDAAVGGAFRGKGLSEVESLAD